MGEVVARCLKEEIQEERNSTCYRREGEWLHQCFEIDQSRQVKWWQIPGK